MNPNVIKSQIQDRNLNRALDQVPPQYRDALTAAALASQVVFKRDPYYSKGRLTAAVTTDTAGDATYTWAKGIQSALFSYGVNDQLVGAGFATGVGYDTATFADTNLIHGGETNAAELELITGIGFILTGNNDPKTVNALMQEVYMSAGTNGQTNEFKWGPPMFWPGGAGLFGSKQSFLETPPLDYASQVDGGLTSGIPGAEDYSRDIDPILWGPKGQADSTFTAVLQVQRTVSFTTLARASATGVAEVIPPAEAYVEFWLRLYGAQFAPRGANR